jgi:glycosyltransferase involved in cell wall biosynthesis
MIPKVSIITLTHPGREKYLPEMIQSVKNQTLTDWELIVVDNGTYDDTAKIINELSDGDKRFVYIKNETDPGISQARNQGLKAARGEFLAVLDSDDLWADQEKLAKQIDYLNTHPDCAAVGTAIIVIDEAGKEISRYQNLTDSAKVKQTILYKNPLAHSSVLMRTAGIDHLKGYDESLPFLEDYDLWLRMAVMWKLANLPEFMTKYRKHQGNVTQEKILAMMKMNIKLIVKYRRDYPGFWGAYLRRTGRYLVKKLLR